MPADFLLSSINTAPSRASATGDVDLSQSNQRDSSADRAGFQREFEREIQRSNERTQAPPRREPEDTRSESAAQDSRRDDHQAATRRTDSDQGGKSLPDRTAEHRTDNGQKRADHDQPKAGDEQSRRTGAATQAHAGQASSSSTRSDAKALATENHQENQQATKASLVQLLAGQQLSAQQRQALEGLRAELSDLQLNKLTAEERLQLMEQFQAMAQDLGLDTKALVAQIKDLLKAEGGGASTDSMQQMLADLMNDKAGPLKDLLQKLNDLQAQQGSPLESTAGENASSDNEGQEQDQPAVAALLQDLKQWLDRVLEESPEKATDADVIVGGGQDSQQANSPAAEEAGPTQVTDLTALLNGNGFSLNPVLAGAAGSGANSGNDGNGGKNAASPWALTQLQAGQGFVVKSSLADKISALSRGVSGSDSDAATSGATGDSESGKSEIAKDIDFLMKNADKLTAKSKESLGELSLADLANQAKQMLKQADGPMQQKLKAAVDQIKSALAETAKADSTGSDSSTSRSSSSPTQPVTAFMRALEQASAGGNVQKAQMTMQNHFNKPAWGNELGQRLMMMVGQKIQVAEIRLDPPDLGPMEVKVRMQQDQAHVVFHSQHAAVRDALEQAVPRLRELFDQNGLGLGDVDVQDQTAQQRQGEDQNGDARFASGSGDTEGDSDALVTEQVSVTSSDRLVDFYA